MGNEKSISVIVMRDQGKTFSLRFSPSTFRLFVSAFIIVPILFILSIWFGLSTYQKYTTVLDEAASLKKKMEQNRQTVTRLANLERFLEKYSPSMLGLLVTNEPVDIEKLPVIQGDKELLVNELAKSFTSEEMSFDIIKDTKQENNNTVKIAQKDKQDTFPQKIEQVTTDKENKKEELVQKKDKKQEIVAEKKVQEDKKEEVESQQVDLNVVSVEKFTAKITTNVLNIQFHLANEGKIPVVSGSQKYYISSLVDGRVQKEEIINASDMTFKIKKLKVVKSSADITGIIIGKNPRLILEIISKGKIIYKKYYPLV